MHYAISATIFIVGLMIVITTRDMGDWNGFQISQIGSSAGSFLCAASVFSAFFEFRGKQAIAEYVWSEAKAAFDVKQSGIVVFLEDASFSNLSTDIKKAKQILSVTAYSSRFLKRYESEVSECLRAGGEVTIVVQSENSPTIRSMKKLGWDEGDIDANFRANREIANRLSKNGNFKLLYHEGVRAYSCIKIDEKIHVSFATNSNGRHKVPKIVGIDTGGFGKFIVQDCKRLLEQCRETNGD